MILIEADVKYKTIMYNNLKPCVSDFEKCSTSYRTVATTKYSSYAIKPNVLRCIHNNYSLIVIYAACLFSGGSALKRDFWQWLRWLSKRIDIVAAIC